MSTVSRVDLNTFVVKETAMHFDTIIDRKGSGCYKWDYLEQFYGDDNILPMSVADMDLATPEPILQSLRDRLDHPVLGYTGQQPSYWNAIVQWMENRHGWTIETDWLVDIPGVIPAMHFCIQAFTDVGDKVLVQTPVYDPFFQAVERNKRTLISSPLIHKNGRYLMDWEDLEHHFKRDVKMMILCSPHNPVGRVWTKEELTRLIALAEKYGVWLISDEIHHDIVYPGHIHYMLGRLADGYDRVITLTSPAKTFNIQGLQCAAAILPHEGHRIAFKDKKFEAGLYLSNTLSMVAYEAAYTHGAAWVDELVTYLDGNRQALRSAFAETEAIDLIYPDGTYVAWLDCRSLGKGSLELKDFFVKEAKVGLNKGIVYGQEADGFMRINFALPKSQLVTAVEDIISAADRSS